MTTCDVCQKTRRADRHPCRFERCCSCWRGIPCIVAKCGSSRPHGAHNTGRTWCAGNRDIIEGIEA